MKQFWVIAPCLALVVILWRPKAAHDAAFVPDRNHTYTSSREIDHLIISANDTVWAFTGGGVLRFNKGVWTKFPTAPPEFDSAKQAAGKATLQWRGHTVTPSLEGLRIDIGKAAHNVVLPPSSGTHISAILPRGNTFWVALFGDGIWQWDGKEWTRPGLNLPSKAREITSLAQSRDGNTLWLGTRRQGIWRRQNGLWKQFLQPNEPYAHNMQFLQGFQNALWASTLEDGLIRHDARGWKYYDKSVLSSNAPRQMVVFQKKLYVRHSNEVVDCFDGHRWARNVFPRLPRKQIISMAADSNRLYLGQWGGWSEWDGTTFVHHLKISELQIVPLLQILPDSVTSQGKRLWLGTENRGLFEWDARRQRLRHHDERQGLPDDWITSLARSGTVLFAGTFNGGLAWRDDKDTKWHSVPSLNRIGITAMVPDGAHRTYIATRFGLYYRNDKGVLHDSQRGLAPHEREIQALLQTARGLWIGTRNGLLFRTHSSLVSMEG